MDFVDTVGSLPIVMKRINTRLPRFVAYSKGYGQQKRKTSSHDRGLVSLLGRLKEGIAFEQSRGHQNWPGQNQIFSDFLHQTLLSIERECQNQEMYRVRLEGIVKVTSEYNKMTEQKRAKVLEHVKRAIDDLDGGKTTTAENIMNVVEVEDLVGYTPRGYVPLVLDLEATDFCVRTSHVVEMCVQNLLTKESFVTRVRLPDHVEMSKDAARVTGISTADVKGTHVPTFNDAMNGFLAFIQKYTKDRYTPLLIGHNINVYDVPLLKNRMADFGLEDCFEGFEYLDTLRMCRKIYPDLKKYNLGYVVKDLVGKDIENAHSALGDVDATVSILECTLDNHLKSNENGMFGISDGWDLLFRYLKSNGIIHEENATTVDTKLQNSVANHANISTVSRNELLDMASMTITPLTDEDFEYWGTQDKSIIAELSTQINHFVDFVPSEKKALTQMQCQTLYDVMYYLPREYIVASVGVFPSQDTMLEQAIALPVYLENIRVSKGKFSVLNASFRCLDGEYTKTNTWRHNPLLEYKVFRRGRGAGWAIAKEEERIRSMGEVFGIYAKVTVDGTGKFVIKEKTLELIHVREFQKLRPLAKHLRPIYPLKNSVTNHTIVDMISKAIHRLEEVENTVVDPIPLQIRKRNNILRHVQALKGIHQPQSMEHFAHARYSLAFYELFFMQLRLMWRSSAGEDEGPKVETDLTLQRMVMDALQFPLTDDQIKALEGIQDSFSSKRSASVFLQGDVGCGKTIVALLSALAIIPLKKQVAFMAPTEVLAEQHVRSLDALLSNEKLPREFKKPKYALLTGSTKSAERKQILENLASGDIDIIIGTHALISSPVIFQHLGLAIIDEQHKFGVEQRAAMLSKGNPAPHILNMSATPIPRSLALVLYGEMDLIEIKEMPPGRIPVQTSVWLDDANTRQALIHEMNKEIENGGKCFIVCPLIDTEEDGEHGMRTVLGEKERLSSTKEIDSTTIGFLHGRMSSAEKEEILKNFASPSGSLKVLISTTVVEVGVNVPDATLMIVEHAERFGLAQLHQLRGRVGRGTKQSKCILVANETSSGRLSILEETNSGFLVAEADLQNRGSGDIIGTAQAGQANANSAHLWELPRDAELVSIARQEAASFLAEHGSQTDQWPSHVSEALHHASTIDLDIHELPNFTL